MFCHSLCLGEGVRIHYLLGEQLLLQCTAGHTQTSGGYTIFSWASLGPMVVVQQILKTTEYLNITADQLHLYMASGFPTGSGMLQQDNAPCHKAQIELEWFQEHDAKFQVMSWPFNSMDLNPIEHICYVIER